MPDQSGGTGPFLTKDQFHQWKDEYHEMVLRAEKQRAADTEKILKAIKDSQEESRADCREDSDRNAKRIDKLEEQMNAGKILGGVAAAIATILGALGIWYK